MKQQIIALLLALAVALSLGAVSALAQEQTDSSLQTEAPESAAQTEEAPDAASEGAPEEEAPPSLAGPDAEPEIDPETGELAENVAIVPDELGSVTFANVERRMRENNLQVLVLQENVEMLESIDYDELYEDLRKQLNQIAKGQWAMVQMGQSGSLAYEQMEQAYDALRTQFDAIKDGEMQEDNAGSMRQVKNLQDQIILAGESTYIALAAMDIQAAALERQLAALDRTAAEMELRYTLGQISALQLSEVKTGRTTLASGLETLRMNIRTYKSQMEMLLGAEMTGQLRLGAVPAVTERDLASMDLEKDLDTAKEKSYELYSAEKTLQDEQKAYKDAGVDHSYNEERMEFRRAKHTWQAAQYTYNNTVQDYERRFRVLFDQVKDYQQILGAARVSLESEKASYAASQLKYQQGTISKNALLSAEDELKTAEETVQTAANDLFSAYNTYCWAVQHGILN